MQQRQLRLGDILDDYCPRERRVTNHAVVAMIGDDVKQTRCTTCDADHEYKHAKVPRQRRKTETPAVLYSQVAAGAPKRVAHEHPLDEPALAVAAPDAPAHEVSGGSQLPVPEPALAEAETQAPEPSDDDSEGQEDGGDVFAHRPLIRAQLPRHEGQPPPQRQAPDFTIRQPAGRPGRFRPRNQRGGGQPFGGNGNRGNGAHGSASGNYGQSMRGGAPRQHGGRPNNGSSPFRPGRNQGPGGAGRKRSK
jgi:hypothetical protein